MIPPEFLFQPASFFSAHFFTACYLSLTSPAFNGSRDFHGSHGFCGVLAGFRYPVRSSHRDTSRFHPGTFHDRSLHHAHGRPLSHSLPQHTTHTGRRHVSMPAPETPYSIQQQMQECRLLFFFINSFPHFIFYSRLKNTTALFQNVGSEKNFLLIYITWKKLYNGMEQVEP